MQIFLHTDLEEGLFHTRPLALFESLLTTDSLVLPGASCWPSLCLSFLVCKVGAVLSQLSQEAGWELLHTLLESSRGHSVEIGDFALPH